MSEKKQSGLEKIPWIRRYKWPVIGGAAGVILIAAAVVLIVLAPWKKPAGSDEEFHYWDNGVVMAESTCTSQGIIKYTCGICGLTRQEYLPLLPHEADGEYLHDADDHWHICKNCGRVFDLAAHKWKEETTPVARKTVTRTHICEFCGAKVQVTEDGGEEGRHVVTSDDFATLTTTGNGDYLFVPRLDGANFTVRNQYDQKIAVGWEKDRMGYAPKLTVPAGAGKIAIIPDGLLKSKAELEALLRQGRTEIRLQASLEITGGKWFGGSLTVGADWTDNTWSAVTNADDLKKTPDDNVTFPFTARFSLADLIANYDRALSEGLFYFQFNQWKDDVYTIAFTAVEIVTDHDWAPDWKRDEENHYHLCRICGATKDVAAHTRTDLTHCSVCGNITVELFTPDSKESNFDVKSGGNKEYGSKDLNSNALFSASFPQEYGTASIFSPDMDFVKLQKLEEMGYTEVEFQIQLRVIGGAWYDLGNFSITAPWSPGGYSAPKNALPNSTGPVTVRFSLAKLLENADKIKNGELPLFVVYVQNHIPDEWAMDILTPLQATVDHEFTDDWAQDKDAHFHACSICGEEQEGTREAHKFGPGTPLDCEVCGRVHRYILEPDSVAGHLTDTPANDVPSIEREQWKDTLYTTAYPPSENAEHTGQYPNGTGKVTFKASAFDMTLEEVRELIGQGFKEVIFTVRGRIIPPDTDKYGKWYPGTYTVTFPWGKGSWSAQTNNVSGDPNQNNTPVFTVKFSLAEFAEHYEEALSGGLFTVYFNQCVDDWWAFDILSGVDVTVDHEDSGWLQDEEQHHRECIVCGEILDAPQDHVFSEDDPLNCEVCGRVHRYLFTPQKDAGNLSVSSATGKSASYHNVWGDTLFGACWAPGSGDITLKANALNYSLEQLKEFLAKGFTEVTVTVRGRIVPQPDGQPGHPWHGGTFTFKTPWGSASVAQASNLDGKSGTDDDNRTGNLLLRMSLAELVANYDKARDNGLLLASFGAQVDTWWAFDILTPFEVTIDHNFDTGHWAQDDDGHFHACTVCGAEQEGSREAHTFGDDPLTCETCGRVHRYLFTPKKDGSNMTDSSEFGVPLIDRGIWEDTLYTTAYPPSENAEHTGQYPKGAGTVTFKAAAFDRDAANIKKLLDMGFSEIVFSVRGRIIPADEGKYGMWYPGRFVVSSPWGTNAVITQTVAEPSSPDYNNTPVFKVRLSLQEFYDHYDEALSDGLFSVFYSRATDNWWAFDIVSPFEITVDHDDSAWTQDLDRHYHKCSICGKVTGTPENHKFVDGNIFKCETCGDIHYYLLNPAWDGGNIEFNKTYTNFTYDGTSGNTPYSALFEPGAVAGAVALKGKPLGLTADQLQKLLDAGATEVTVTLKSRVCGGKGWGGKLTIASPWGSGSWTANVTNGGEQIKIRLPLSELVANYDKAQTDGLLTFSYDNSAWDRWTVDIVKPFEVVVDHDPDTAWHQDEENHYHVCKVCGAHTDVAPHDMADNFSCKTCGTVHRYLFTPQKDGSNLTVTSTSGKATSFANGWGDSYVTVQVEPDTGVITLKPNALGYDLAALQALKEKGYSSVDFSVRIRITGGSWYGGTIKYSFPWSDTKRDIGTKVSGENTVTDVIRISVPLDDLIAKFDAASGTGILSAQYVTTAQNDSAQWHLDVMSPFEIVPPQPEFSDTKVVNGSAGPNTDVGAEYSIAAKNTEHRKVHYSLNNADWQDTLPKFVLPGNYTVYWKVDADGTLPAYSGSNKVSVRYFLHDLDSITGVKGTFDLGTGGSGKSEGSSQFGGDISRNDRHFLLHCPLRTKPKSIKFYAPLLVSKEALQKLADAGATSIAVTLTDTGMQGGPGWGLNGKAGAQWTATVNDVVSANKPTKVTFPLADLIAHYDEIKSGSMALFTFDYSVNIKDNGFIYWADHVDTAVTFDIDIRDIIVDDAPAAAADEEGEAPAKAPLKASETGLPAFFRKIFTFFRKLFGLAK